MNSDTTVSIGLLLPDILGTYSDTGNATVLAQRLHWRGIPARVLRCTADMAPPLSCELYVLGGGEDVAQLYAARWLRENAALRNALSDSAVTFAVCAGMQILGRWMTAPDGSRYAGAELLDLSTSRRRRRATGEAIVNCAIPDVGLLSGFENHSGATELAANTQPLGQVVKGVGNGHRRRRTKPVEGVLTERIVATYMHGPVLARNPALADHLLGRVIGSPLPELNLPDQYALRATYLKSRNHTPRRPRRWIS